MDKLEGLILRYWDLSKKNLLFNFQFEEAFILFRNRMKEKLSLHGMLTLDDYVSFVNKYYDVKILESFAYTSFHTGFKDSVEALKIRLFKPRYEHFRSLYKDDPIYRRILKTYWCLCNPPNNLSNQILLMERAINVAHRDGLFLNVEALRSYYETKIKQLSNDHVFNVLTRSALEMHIREFKNPFFVIFIDFIDIKKENEARGYEEVNKLISFIIDLIRLEKCIIGRWFSGDEILIISQEPFEERYTQYLLDHANKYDIKFKPFFLGKQENIKSLKKIINNLPMIKRKRDRIRLPPKPRMKENK